MEGLETSQMIDGIVAYLGKKQANGESESIQEFTSEFSIGTRTWLENLFLTKGSSGKEIIQKFKQKPSSTPRQTALKSFFEMELEDNTDAALFIKEIFEQLLSKEKLEKGSTVKQTIIKGYNNILFDNSNNNNVNQTNNK